MKFSCSFALTVLLISGCASTLQDKESKILSDTPPNTTGELAIAGNMLARGYLDAADNSATVQDVSALSLIGLASYGAYGAIDGFGAGALAEIGLTGFGISQSISYFDTPGANRKLLNAASRAACISQVAFADPNYALGTPHYRAIQSGFLENALVLRTELARDIPDYAQIIRDAQEASDAFTPDDQELARSSDRKSTTLTAEENAARLERIQLGVAECLSGNL